MDRRDFLKTSAVAAVGLGLGLDVWHLNRKRIQKKREAERQRVISL